MSVLSWGQFDQNQQAKDIGFESFCYQVAYILYHPYGSFSHFFNTPGSEFYLLLNKDCEALGLKAGDEIGWQVKWWFDSEENTSLAKDRREKLEENFRTTLNRHADIKKWIVCTPGAFVESAFIELKTKLTALSPATLIASWSKNDFINFKAAQPEQLGSLFSYYFNTTFIGFEFFRKHSQAKIDDLAKKFDADLYVPTRYDKEIHLMMNIGEMFRELKQTANYIRDEVQKINEITRPFKREHYPSFTEEYIVKADEILRLCLEMAGHIVKLLDGELNLAVVRHILVLLDEHTGKYRVLADFLNNKLQTKTCFVVPDKGEHANDTYRHQRDLIEPINELQSWLTASSNIEDRTSVYDIAEQVLQHDLHILSSAGYGKTNIACHICKTFLDARRPCLLILASAFRKPELPQKLLLELLGLERQYSFRDLLTALNALGLQQGFKIPIVIDGLNESKPYDDIWRSHIKDMIREVREFDYVMLITTCRDRYLEAIFEEPDRSKIENTKLLVGFAEKRADKAIKKYFGKYDIIPHSWQFNKDLFQNPLLLKIFSEVNQGARDMHITIQNILTSVEKYFDYIVERASRKNSAADPILKKKILDGIEKFAQRLWDSEAREVSLPDFHACIDPQHPSLTDSLTASLLDEGICFQRNLNSDEEFVQFTYDLVGGYVIASRVLLKGLRSLETLPAGLEQKLVAAKLFDKSGLHPLAQDITVAFIHLLPERFGVQLIEVFPNEMAITESINIVDSFIGNRQAQTLLLDTVNGLSEISDIPALLFQKLYENSYLKRIAGLGHLTLACLKEKDQAWIDLQWTELLRKNVYDVLKVLRSINKACLSRTLENPLADLFVSFLATTSSDQSVRDLATENMYLAGCQYPAELLQLAGEATGLNDLNALESLIAALCGICLTNRDRQLALDCLNYLQRSFVPAFKHTHICIIDYCWTMAEFAEAQFGINGYQFEFDSSYFNTQIPADPDSAVGNSYFPRLFGLDLYEFNKLKIKSIASDSYHKRQTFSSVECLLLIKQSILARGYDEARFNVVNESLYEDRRYRYGEGRNKPNLYAEKYLMQSYFELEGYLALEQKLELEYGRHYRSGYTHFDPTFPRLPQKFQLINECFYPEKDADVKAWVADKRTDHIKPYLHHDLHEKGDWILLDASINQKGEDNRTDFYISVTTFLLPERAIKRFSKLLRNGDYHDTGSQFYQTFAGEINWSSFTQKQETDYYEAQYEVFNTLDEYTWRGYTSRYDHPNFHFLNRDVFDEQQFIFDPATLTFYDPVGKPLTRIVWTERIKLYYIDRLSLETLLKTKKLNLIWSQFLSKSAQMGPDDFSGLGPYSKHRKVLLYHDIVGSDETAGR